MNIRLIILFSVLAFNVNSQSRIKFSQMENPATSSVNLGSQTFSVGNIRSNGSFSTTGSFSINQSGGVNTLSPKKFSIQPWTYDNSYLVEYAAQNIPGTFNVSRVWDSTLQKISGPRVLYLGTGAANGLQIQSNEINGATGTNLADGHYYFTSGAATNTSVLNGSIPLITLPSLTYSMTGGTTANAYLVKVIAPNIKANAATNLTEWATMNFPAPTFDGNITPSRVFGITTPTDISVGGRGIFGLSSTAPSATLDVRGTMSVSSTATLASTLKLGSSAVLTGGNTGTVAVLSDAVFPIQFGWNQQNPADNTTYGLTQFGSFNANHGGANALTLPYNCTLIGYSFNTWNLTTAGSAGTATLMIGINGTTPTNTLSTSLSFTTGAIRLIQNDFAQSIDFAANDNFYVSLKTPTWATNPAANNLSITFWFVRRQ